MRLIDADDLKNYIDLGHLRPPTEVCFSELDVVQMLDGMPTIDAEPVRHGRWEHGMQCPYCKQIDLAKPNYCPNCGAKMDEEVRDAEDNKE